LSRGKRRVARATGRFIPAEPSRFPGSSERALEEKQVELICGMPCNMNGTGRLVKVEEFVAAVSRASRFRLRPDERLTGASQPWFDRRQCAARKRRRRWTKWLRRSCCRAT
jgi:hypothetical protein